MKVRPTKLPVVLCHGLFGFDQLGPKSIPALQIHYWANVAEQLKNIGCEVHIARVPSTGNIQERAIHLKNFVESRLPGRDVNFIAHSMGGLDCRYLITHMNCSQMNFCARSLTTISTPHRGSPFMDWIRDTIGVGLTEGDKKVALWKLMSALDAPAYSNLTTDYLTQVFNPTTPDDPNVRYFSYGASIDEQSMSKLSPLRYPWEIVRRSEGDNDGFVSVFSARWGSYVKTVPADHFVLTKSRRVSLDLDSFYSKYLPNISLDFGISLKHLTKVGAILHPLLSSLPTSVGSVSQDQSKDPEKPNIIYRKRIQQILDRMYGPNSFEDYVYGYESAKHNENISLNDYFALEEDSTKKVQETSVETKPSDEFDRKNNSFDTHKLYLEIISNLSKEGL